MSKTNMHHIDDCADKRTQSEVLAGTARPKVVPWRASTGVMRALTPILVLLLATSEAFGWVVKTSEFSEGRMKNPDQSNFAFAPASPAAGPKLLLFLAGSGAKLEGYTDFMEEAAKDGYYVIGLAYRNDHSHTDLCGCMAECMGLMEQQNVTGIDIGNAGVAAESNTIRIGTSGTQTATFVAGIRGITIAGAQLVGVNASGQLGIRASSARFKENIKPMDEASEAILSLQPVTFRYKKQLDPTGASQFGLIAEEVAEVSPDLVTMDDQGKPLTVRYDEVNAMLLNEFLKEHGTIQEQKATISRLQSALAQQREDFRATAAQQEKEIKTLAAGLQKVSNQLELTKPVARVVANNQ
jgi:hypothetical protein